MSYSVSVLLKFENMHAKNNPTVYLSQLDQEIRRSDALARNDSSQTQTRVALVKLQKDFERVRAGVRGVLTDALNVEVAK
jgi:hypothetical protein